MQAKRHANGSEKDLYDTCYSDPRKQIHAQHDGKLQHQTRCIKEAPEKKEKGKGVEQQKVPQASPYIHLEMLCRRIEGSGVEAVLLAKLNSPPE